MTGKAHCQKMGISQAQKEASKRYKDKNKDKIQQRNLTYYNNNRDNLCDKAMIKYYLTKE